MRSLLHHLGLLALLSSAGFSAGCTDAPSKKECQQLHDHVIELVMKEQGADRSSPEQNKKLDEQKATVREQTSKTMMDECLKNLPGKQVRCALKAGTMEEVAKREAGS